MSALICGSLAYDISWSYIMTAGRHVEIPPARANALVHPTGCGDAYRAGLLYGLMQGMEWKTTGRIASLAGALKIEKPGTQYL